MFNIKTVSILFIMMFVASINVYAGNIGRAVYGVLTETYNGAGGDSSAGNDYIHVYGSATEKTTNPLEGKKYVCVGASKWFGAVFNSNQNMSAYSGGKLYFSLKVPSSLDIEDTGNAIKLKDTAERIVYFNSTNIKRVDTGSSVLGTGVKADGNWHTYYIELSNFESLDLSNMSYIFIISSTLSDNTVCVDNVYWTKSGSKSFNVTIKNISNNATASNVSWAESTFRQGWQAAQQYLEIDLDQDSNNWYVQIYADNGKKERNGLYCVKEDGSEEILTMAWRVSPNLLPNSSGDTLQIAQYQSGEHGLYDSGKNPGGTDWYTWAYMKEKNDTLDDYTKVWTLKGYHAIVGTHDSWDTLYSFYERKPKIYLAADCSKALGGLVYNANIVVRLSYE